MRINSRRNEIGIKIVYYGPGLSGKTTNLAWLHQRLPQDRKGDLIQLDTETERTLFFDYFPYDLGSAGDYTIKVDFFTVPGQSFYHETRRAVLDGVDGIVFVADSSPEREHANELARLDMLRSLEGRGRSLDDVPHVYQWNKRDVRQAVATRILERVLNPEGAPSFEAVASSGEGVFETQDAIVREVLDHVAT
ncbi:MAG: gliding-motility protein MglA [Alphaproteobacteria bacterium]|nr:gliding-motility protein MglA [Alphaproteobacteria bacterium]